MSTNDLLPCPFCGGEADLHVVSDGTHAQCFSCEANSAIFDGSRFGKGRDHEFAAEDAIAAWNKRAPDPNVKTLRDEYRMFALTGLLGGLKQPVPIDGDSLQTTADEITDLMMATRKVQP